MTDRAAQLRVCPWVAVWCIAALFCARTAMAQTPAPTTAQTTAQTPVFHPEPRALDFAKNFSDHCIAQKENLPSLRAHISRRWRTMPPAQASAFLSGLRGDAWYVPSIENEGNMVLSMDAPVTFCALFARRAAWADTETLFQWMLQAPDLPYTAEKIDDIWSGEGHHKRHTVTYLWSRPQGPHRLIITLTTSESDIASIQALASVRLLPP